MADKIDFSAKHDILILNPDGTVQPMDEPYFQETQIAKNTWQILSDGDYSYLVAGSDAAISIDTGYGCGNIREFEQTLTQAPVRYAANTHDHFDHTAGNAYFEAVFMSAATEPLATIPYPSFAGIEFPKASEIHIVEDGDVIDLGDRKLLVISMPDHAVGSLLFLDEKERLLFAGDEIGDFKRINGTVAHIQEQLQRLMSFRDRFDTICAGPGIFPADMADRLLEAVTLILDGSEGKPAEAGLYRAPVVPGYEERMVYMRRGARPEDLPPDFDRQDPFKRVFMHAGVGVQYDVRMIK